MLHKLKRVPIIINEFSGYSRDAIDAVHKEIYTRYQPSDILQNEPRCTCGNYDKRRYEGMTCEICHDVCENPREARLESRVWLKTPKSPKGEEVGKFINPQVLIILLNHFKKRNFNVIQYLMDTDYKIPAKAPSIIPQLLALELPRGYNNFVKHFFEIIEKLMTLSDFRRKKRDTISSIHPILRWLYEEKDKIFSEYLALPNKTLLVVEDTDMSTYVDSSSPIAVDAIVSLIGLDDPLKSYSSRARQNRVARSQIAMTYFYSDYYQNFLSQKEGAFRKHSVATRNEMAFRGVITSIPGVHHYRELHLPWGIGIGLFRHHLAAKLLARGWMVGAIARFLNRYVFEYNPLLDELFQELIAEATPRPDVPNIHGIACVFQRNPSLGLASMLSLFITKVKTDPRDPTISWSPQCVRGPNADYDGDEMNGTLAIDDYMAMNFEKMAPYKSIMSSSTPRMMSDVISKTKPWISAMAYFLEAAPTLPADPIILKRMARIPDAPPANRTLH